MRPVHLVMAVLVWYNDDIPNPAAPRYCNTGQPSPPAPTTMTFAFFNLSWAFLVSIWRQNPFKQVWKHTLQTKAV